MKMLNTSRMFGSVESIDVSLSAAEVEALCSFLGGGVTNDGKQIAAELATGLRTARGSSRNEKDK